MQEKDMLLTVKEVSEELKCSKAAVYRLIHNNLLPVLKIGNLKVRRNSLEEFLAKYEGYDVTDPSNVKMLDMSNIIDMDNTKVG